MRIQQHFRRKRCILHCYMSVYVAGSAWTGALGLGHNAMIQPDTSDVSDDDREDTFTELRYKNSLPDSIEVLDEILNVAAGWGHSAFIVTNQNTPRLLVCGRPYDFQTLLRLKRLPSFLRRPLIWTTLLFDEEKHATIRPLLTEIPLPMGDTPMNTTVGSNAGKVLAASAGTTAVVGQSGNLYMFGINQRGQCGINQPLTNHVWEPTSLVISPSVKISYKPKFVSVALGLQHGLAIDTEGSLFSWGKGNRGQLGVRKVMGPEQSPYPSGQFTDSTSSNWFSSLDLTSCEYAALKVTEFHLTDSVHGKDTVIPASNIRVSKISAGFNHSAAITDSNHAWVWGKNTKLTSSTDTSIYSNMASDSQVPINIKGLPSNLLISDISCGSHHTSILMEDGSVFAIGIATDTLEPLVGPAVQIIPPGMIQLPVQQFTSHFDRTTVVGKEGSIMEVHLWEDANNGGVFEPGWVKGFHSQKIKMVHRGWLHTIVVTEK